LRNRAQKNIKCAALNFYKKPKHPTRSTAATARFSLYCLDSNHLPCSVRGVVRSCLDKWRWLPRTNAFLRLGFVVSILVAIPDALHIILHFTVSNRLFLTFRVCICIDICIWNWDERGNSVRNSVTLNDKHRDAHSIAPAVV